MKETGRKTRRELSPPSPNGTKVPLLVIAHGAFKVIAREQGTCLIVSAPVQVTSEVRKKLSGLPPEDKPRVLITLRGELASNSRTGYAYHPPNLTTIDQLEGFVAEQLLKISKDNIGSFNRLCDAIQEVVTVATKGIAILGLFVPPQSTSSAVRPASATLYG